MTESGGFCNWSWRQHQLLGDEPLYCEAPRLPGEPGLPHEEDFNSEEFAKRRIRCETYGLRYLEGKPISLLSTKLHGPFEAAKGWRNPWITKKTKQSRITASPTPQTCTQTQISSVISDAQVLPAAGLTTTNNSGLVRSSQQPYVDTIRTFSSPLAAPLIMDSMQSLPVEPKPSSDKVTYRLGSAERPKPEQVNQWTCIPGAAQGSLDKKGGIRPGLWWLRRRQFRFPLSHVADSRTPETPSGKYPAVTPPAPRRKRSAKLTAPISASGNLGENMSSRSIPDGFRAAINPTSSSQLSSSARRHMDTTPVSHADDSFHFRVKPRDATSPRDPPFDGNGLYQSRVVSPVSSLSRPPDLGLGSGLEGYTVDPEDECGSGGEDYYTPSSSHGSNNSAKLMHQRSQSVVPGSDSRIRQTVRVNQGYEFGVSTAVNAAKNPEIDQIALNETSLVASQDLPFRLPQVRVPEILSPVKSDEGAKSCSLGLSIQRPKIPSSEKPNSTSQSDPTSSTLPIGQSRTVDRALGMSSHLLPTAFLVDQKDQARYEASILTSLAPVTGRSHDVSTSLAATGSFLSTEPEKRSIMNQYQHLYNVSIDYDTHTLPSKSTKSFPTSPQETQQSVESITTEDAKMVIPMSGEHWVFNSSRTSPRPKPSQSSSAEVGSKGSLTQHDGRLLDISHTSQRLLKSASPTLMSSPPRISRKISSCPAESFPSLNTEGLQTSMAKIQSPWTPEIAGRVSVTSASLSPAGKVSDLASPRVVTQQQSPWFTLPQILKCAFTYQNQIDLPNDVSGPSGLMDSIAPTASLGVPISIRPFSSIMCSPPKRRKLNEPQACTRGGSFHSMQQLFTAGSNPWASSPGSGSRRPPLSTKPRKQVHWAPLPSMNEDGSPKLPERSQRRPCSPPPSKDFTFEPGQWAPYSRHFSSMAEKAMKRPKSIIKKSLVPSESQQANDSPGVMAMAEMFIHADTGAKPSGSSPTDRKEGSEDDSGSRIRETPSASMTWNHEVTADTQTLNNDDVTDVLSHLDDFVGGFNLEIEMVKVEKAALEAVI